MKISLIPAQNADNVSSRIRVFLLAQALQAAGQETHTQPMPDVDLLFIQKKITPDLLAYARLVKARGGRVIYDLDESHEEKLAELDIRPEDWQTMVGLADLVTTDTPERARLLALRFPQANLAVLPGGIDTSPDKAAPAPIHDDLRIIWFGSVGNLYQIAPLVPTLRTLGAQLHVVTDRAALPELGKMLPDFKLHPWSQENFSTLLQQGDLALLTQTGDKHEDSKSNGEMLTAIANGLVPLVSSCPAYRALAQALNAEDSIYTSPETLAEAVSTYADRKRRQAYLDRAQPYIQEHYGPAALANYFLGLLETFPPRVSAPQPEAPLAPTFASARSAPLPHVSVIIPTKDRPHLLAQALQSLQYQTYRCFEVVIANDGGCDVGDVVDYFGSHFPITYIRRSTSGGAAAARNMALSAARGNIIAYLDDDDYYFTHHLETIATALENTAFDFVYSDAEYVVHKMVDGRPMETTRTRPYQIRPYSRDDLLVANYIPTPTWAHRASLLKQIGGFDESMTILEDWDFLLRASAVARIQKIERLSVEVRQAAFRQDHTLPSAARQLPGFKQLYARYPAPNASVERLRQILLQELETPQGPSQYRVPTAFEDGYPLWVNKHSLEPIHGQVHAERMMAWQRRPHFLLLMPVRQQEMEQLAKTIDGLQQQLYQGWQLIVLSDQPTPNDIFNQSEVLGWLQLDSLEDEQTLVAGCNAVIENIPSDWVALLPPGTTLEPNALLSIGDYAQLHPEWQAIYSDHDFLSATGQRQDPWFKPDFSLDYLRSMDYVGSAVWFQTQALRSAGSFAPFPGALQYDALLRIFDQEGGFSSIGHIAEPLVHLPFSQTEHPLAQASRQVAVEAHLARRKVPGQVEQGLLPGTLRVAYPLERTPLVSIIIPNRDSVWYLRPCLETLFQKTDYTHYEVIIVDNQTEDPDTLAYYDELAATHSERVRIVHYDRPFNFSAQCNLGVEAAQGELILLLNNDTEIIQANWLSRMVAHALRPEVGIVGARLVYPETGKVQHAGVILGLDRLASHGFMNLDMKDPGYLNRLQVEQNYSAVTAACMLVAKELFIQVSGMDEQDTPVLFNDVDFCLKVRELGKLIVWTPYATLVHHESKSLQSELQEIKRRAAIVERDSATALALHVRWKKWLREDPAYNRHLALSTNRSFHVESELVADWDTNFHDRQRILAFPPAGGVGEYRFTAPLKGLTHAARIQSTIVQTRKYHELRYPTLPELNRLEPDVLMQQVDYSPAFFEWQELYRKQRPDMLSVIMIDDLITQMPEDNPNYRRIPRNGRQRLRKLFEQTDRVVVSTQPLFDFVKELTDEVRLVPNSLRDDLWAHLSSQRRVGKKPRVGWAGAQQHKGDLAIISEAVKQTANEVEWVFFGMCPDEIRPYVTEYHQFEVGVEAYPAKLASLNLDLAVAPLQQHPFNEAKSNLRLLEYGVLGLPVVCTDIYPYRTDNAPVTRVANETGAWVQAIRERVHDLDATAKEGDALQQWVRQRYLLSHHLDAWFKALTDPRP